MLFEMLLLVQLYPFQITKFNRMPLKIANSYIIDLTNITAGEGEHLPPPGNIPRVKSI